MTCQTGKVTNRTYYCGDIETSDCNECLCGETKFTFSQYHEEGYRCCVSPGSECYKSLPNNEIICQKATQTIRSQSCNGECEVYGKEDKSKTVCPADKITQGTASGYQQCSHPDKNNDGTYDCVNRGDEEDYFGANDIILDR